MMSASKLRFGGTDFLRAVGVMAAIATIIVCVAHAAPGGGGQQTQGARASAPAYEVVSIKPAKPSAYSGGGAISGSGIQYTADGLRANSTVVSLIESAYGVDADRISGAQGWMRSEKFSIEAKMESSVADELNKLSPEERDAVRQQMLQAFLTDRFKLTVHSDNKQLPVYELVIAKNGPKLHEAKPGDTYPDGLKGGDGKGLGGDLIFGFGTGKVIAQGVDMASFAHGLAWSLKRPVVDKTGLTGRYDFKLNYAADSRATAPAGVAADDGASDPSGQTSLFTALQEQIGLKLEAKKDPLATIVIDHAERPSGN